MDIWQNVLMFFTSIHIPHFKFLDFVEIAIMAFFFYQFVKNIKNTRTYLLLKAFLIFAAIYLIAVIFEFNAIKIIFQALTIVAIFAVIVIFHPELRKMLEKIGAIGFDKFSFKDFKNFIFKKNKDKEIRYSDKTIDELVNGCFSLGEAKTGALIVMEGDVPLNDYIATGIDLNADITSALLINIFEKNTPLHDGAVITVGDKIIAATCYLPLSDNNKISKHLGTRHRAAIGISEIIDCGVIVVSEETGKVSFVYNGNITVCKTPEMLKEKLKARQTKETILQKKYDIKNNWSLKILSALIACISWILIINSADPVVTTTFYDVPVTITNQDVITNINKTFKITSGETVDVIVKDSRSIIDNLQKSDITVTADMSKLSYVYSVPLSAKAPHSSTEISFVKENTLTVELDDIISKEFSLTLNKVGTPPSGIYVSKLTSSVDGIVISGGKSLIDTIDKVEFDVDITGAKENFSQVVSPVVYDKNGKKIDQSLYKLSKNNITVNAELLNTKFVPINIGLIEQEESQNYELFITSYTPKYIYVAGTDELLDEIDEINVEINPEIKEEDISDGLFVKEINIENYLPDNVYCASSSNKIDVELKYNPFVAKTINFSKYDLTVNNENKEYNLYFRNDDYSINIIGKEETIKNLTISDFKPTLDLKDLKEGLYNIKLVFSQISGVKIEKDVSVDIELIKNKQ